jgi:hypothetical protein
MAARDELRTGGRLARMAAFFVVASAATAFAQAEARPGFNLFSVDQDIEIGRQSAAQAERQLPVIHDAHAERYLNAVIWRLAPYAPGARYPYQAKLVDSTDINAFSLPGGFLYVNRGLVEATRAEAELAGVIAHEMGHVALRHGTHQASEAYAAQAGLGILGGLLGHGHGSGGILTAIGGIGLNAAFLKFSRTAEYQADLAGASMMARAGYPPSAMADFFDTLTREEQRNPRRLEQFFSDHPPSADRAARIRAEARRLGTVPRLADVGGFDEVKADLRGRPASSRRAALLSAPEPRRGGAVSEAPRIEPPSPRLRTFEQRDGFFSVGYPENWLVHEGDQGHGAVIAPRGGILLGDSAGGQDIAYGLVINHYDPFDDAGSGSLEDATDDLVRQVQRTSPYLQPESREERTRGVAGREGLQVDLVGRNPASGLEESVTIVTRALPDGHVLYALFVAPRRDLPELRPVYGRMLDSLRVNDRMAHR